jgi:glycosyltransferase involved in cell wall biosynthesis
LLLEAMACALPVVYNSSGGSPELVGDDAGVGVPVPQSWDETGVPDPLQMVRAVLVVLARYSDYAQAARQRTVDQFDAKLWVERHRSIFTRLLEENG